MSYTKITFLFGYLTAHICIFRRRFKLILNQSENMYCDSFGIQNEREIISY